MSLYRLVFGKTCHLLFEIEHKTYWVIQKLNFDARVCEERRLLELYEIDEFKLDAYTIAKIYKKMAKLWHGKYILAKILSQGTKCYCTTLDLSYFLENSSMDGSVFFL